MFGLDDRIAALTSGSSIGIVLAVAVLLGLRHATDPDHLAAVSALIAGRRQRAGRAAGALGLAWGLGHATTLLVFGLPIVVFNRYLPEPIQQGAELLVGVVIVFLAVRLLLRWRRGAFHVHAHSHEGHEHVHLHSHSHSVVHGHPHPIRTRLGAYGIGLLHGMGGSAGVSLLIVAAIDSTPLAVVSLVVLAVFTAVSMTVLTTGFGLTLTRRPVRSAFNHVAPVLGFLSLAFGVWYGLSALGLTPYYS